MGSQGRFKSVLSSARCFIIFLSSLSVVHAQSPDAGTFTVGAGYVLLRTNFLDDGFDKTSSGIAVRGGYSLTKNVDVEAELHLLPRDLEPFSKGMAVGVFGGKAGHRFDKAGIFGKARPGFVHFAQPLPSFACLAIFPPPFNCALGGTTEFALDAGGVVELYPRSRLTLRFDVGDMMIRFAEPTQRGKFWSHNFTFGTSIGFGF